MKPLKMLSTIALKHHNQPSKAYFGFGSTGSAVARALRKYRKVMLMTVAHALRGDHSE